MMDKTLLINLEREDQNEVALIAAWMTVFERICPHRIFLHIGLIRAESKRYNRLQSQIEFKSQLFHILPCDPGQVTCPLHASVSSFVSEDRMVSTLGGGKGYMR